MRRRVLLALILLLSACHGRGDRDPFTDSRIPPNLGPAFWPPQGWAWGLLQVGDDPPQRYGVGAPIDQPASAQLLYLPTYGGVSEEYFETANALIGRRIQVWTLDGVGQGGSGRIADARDLGHVDSFRGDVDGVEQLAATVIRPDARRPLVVVADGAAAPVLLRAAEDRPVGVAALVLTQPRLNGPAHPAAPPHGSPWARWLRYGQYRAPGQGAWRREAPAGQAGSAAFARHAWQIANPDLRMGGPSLGWLAAFDELTAAAKAGLHRVGLPVLVLVDPTAPAGQRRDQAALCRALPHCTLTAAPPDAWPDREADFAAGVVKSAANPPETAPLPIASPGR